MFDREKKSDNNRFGGLNILFIPPYIRTPDNSK